MELRLGWYVCSACGHCEPEEPASEQEFRLPGDDGLHRPRLRLPFMSPSPPAETRTGAKEPAISAADKSLAKEKLVFLPVFFLLQIASSFFTAYQIYIGVETLIYLSNLLIAAVLATAGMGFVLFYDNDCLRQGCLWFLGLAALGTLVGIITAFSTHQTTMALMLIPHLAMLGWLVAILLRDRRSD